MQKTGLPTESETLLQSVHYTSLPFLLASLCCVKGKIKITQSEYFLLAYTILVVLFTRFFLERSGGISIWINILLEPILLIEILNHFNKKDLIVLQRLIIIFLFTEATVALYESITNSIVFADVTNEMIIDLTKNMRAYSLHGHPLMNCFIICIISTIIMVSRLNILIRYICFLVGFLGILAFNSRSAVLFMTFVLILTMLHDFTNRHIGNLNKLFLFFIGLIGVYIISYIISTYDLASRLETGFSTDDGSSMARFMLIKVVLDMSFIDLLLGNNLTQQILNKYTMMATIENSFLNLIFNNGLILTIPYFVYLYKKIKSLGLSAFMFKTIVFITFLLLNTNNIIITWCPSMAILFITLYAFKDHSNK